MKPRSVLGWRPWVGAVAVIAVLAVAGCGNAPVGGGTRPPASAAPTSSAEADTAFCEAVVDVDMSAASGPADLASAAPDQVPAVVQRYADALGTLLPAVEQRAPTELGDVVADLARLNGAAAAEGNAAYYRSPEFLDAYRKIDDYVIRSCDLGQIKVAAAEYSYVGFPDGNTVAGTWALTLTDVGKATHALLVSRIDDSETRPLADILALPSEEARALLEPVGSVRVDPGQTDTVFLRLPAGRYAAYCPVPTPPAPVTTTPTRGKGATTAPPQPPGPPHYTKGEFHEFAVT